MKFLYKISILLFLISHTCVVFAQRRVACIGDSVTKGYGIKDEKDTYPAQLQELLGSDYLVGNFGHSGATLLNKGHNPYTKTQAYQDALNFNPDIIIIALGLNDTDPRNWPNYRNEFVADYSSLIQSFRQQNPKVEVFVCSMTPIFSGHRRFLSGTREWFDQIQSIIPQIVKVNQAKFIDNHKALAARIDLFDDYLHPNAKGARLLAENVFAYLVPLKQALQFDPTFGNHMVLQRNRVNILKGKGTAYQKVVVSFNKKKFETVIDSLGNWKLDLPSQSAGGPFEIEI